MAHNFTTTRIYEREWRDITPSSRLIDHHFGRSRLLDDPFFRRSPFSSSLESLRTAGLNETKTESKYAHSSATSSLKTEERVFNDEKEKFLVVLDVSQFTPEEIKVKVADDMLMIECEQEEKQDEHGFVSRTLKRRYPLPKDVDTRAFVSELTKDGMLTVRAPKIDPRPKERVVPVHMSAKGNRI